MAIVKTIWSGPADKLMVNGECFLYMFRDHAKEQVVLNSQVGRTAMPVHSMVDGKLVRESAFDTLAHAQAAAAEAISADMYANGKLGIGAQWKYMTENGITSEIIIA